MQERLLSASNHSQGRHCDLLSKLLHFRWENLFPSILCQSTPIATNHIWVTLLTDIKSTHTHLSFSKVTWWHLNFKRLRCVLEGGSKTIGWWQVIVGILFWITFTWTMQGSRVFHFIMLAPPSLFIHPIKILQHHKFKHVH